MIILSVSLIFSSYIEIVRIRNLLFLYLTPILLFLFPLVIMIIANVKERKKIKNETI